MENSAQTAADRLVIGTRSFASRLLTGTGKFVDFNETRLATEAAGAEIVTVAIRRTNLGQNAAEPNLLDFLPPDRFTLLPNTAAATAPMTPSAPAVWRASCWTDTTW